jgi:hypothetical protein
MRWRRVVTRFDNNQTPLRTPAPRLGATDVECTRAAERCSKRPSGAIVTSASTILPTPCALHPVEGARWLEDVDPELTRELMRAR